MKILRKIGNALARFMYGRNGVDQLGMVLLWVGLLVEIAASLVQRKLPLLGTIFVVLFWVIWFWMLFRILSKNLYKRRAENSKWLNLWWRIKNGNSGAKARHADKEHKYFTCKSCKTICRVPVGKGKIEITCPKCGAKIHAKT